MYFTKDESISKKLSKKHFTNFLKMFFKDCTILSYEMLPDGAENTCFLVNTTERSLLVRISTIKSTHKMVDRARFTLDEEMRFMEFLHKQGIPIPSVYRQQENSQPYLEYQEQDQCVFVTVTDFIIGSHVNYTMEVVELVAEVQARMHRLAKNYQHYLSILNEEHSAMSIRIKKEHLDSDGYQNQPSGPLYRRLLDVYLENVEHLKEYFIRNEKLLIHCDMKADNILVLDGRLSAVIDFGDIRVSVIAEDLGVFIWDLCDHLNRDQIDFSPYIKMYFQAYSRYSKELSRLEKEMAIRYAIDRYLNINIYYLMENQPFPERMKYQVDKAERQFEIIQCLLKILQEEF
ncbi:Ser/Thr protein kinase RdoA involved in Cpx stress response, MazF antagonist [Thermoactinomyces sp. DSM 45891]|uniref:phosphotransferase enzyme family protein n=1 Tax=Thermoactinomyces sp. DSM 45891 TaxID=1761907 RepID=UPI0009200946|nr:phosphotransferase [Thermoactinomyces sp. DSM 45891]SFX51648.1 Ser/Thr protein kinase RdoA involved in Cpx stress response, MazF antagonist [Thermoactinomyces sp. DSM 45891]